VALDPCCGSPEDRGHVDPEEKEMRRTRWLLMSVVLSLAASVMTPVRADAAVWGACGVITSTSKIVRTFSGVPGIRKVYLTCGGPKFSDEPSWGYRHILRYHRGQFEALSSPTQQNWRDLADLAMATTLGDPAVRGPVIDGKRCFSRALRLYDLRSGRLVRTQIFRVVFRTKDAAIITVYPSSRHC
jgi:hypothetical protein